MISAHVVELASEYLAQPVSTGNGSTLVELLGYVDSRDKSIPNAEEINAALARHPDIMVSRSAGLVSFSQSGTSNTITEADLRVAYELYTAKFTALLRQGE
jgi:hypothetical protein